MPFSKELELWQFISSRVNDRATVILLVVADSAGSSPGRVGYKMAVAEDGELFGSIGGGVMEVRLVEHAKAILAGGQSGATSAFLTEQVHRKNVPNSSGMICSGRQTVILKPINYADAEAVDSIIQSLQEKASPAFEISHLRFQILGTSAAARYKFSKMSETEFVYQERLGPKNRLFVVGGGHCALALSELMARLDFHISIFDDRPRLNTLDKNEFADEVTWIESYDNIGKLIEPGEDTYVVVMTLGYASDAVVIRELVDRDFRYIGVLGSNAKMATLFKELLAEGVDKQRLAAIRTPIGLPINSRTPEEIAISVAAEIISVKNA